MPYRFVDVCIHVDDTGPVSLIGPATERPHPQAVDWIILEDFNNTFFISIAH